MKWLRGRTETKKCNQSEATRCFVSQSAVLTSGGRLSFVKDGEEGEDWFCYGPGEEAWYVITLFLSLEGRGWTAKQEGPGIYSHAHLETAGWDGRCVAGQYYCMLRGHAGWLRGSLGQWNRSNINFLQYPSVLKTGTPVQINSFLSTVNIYLVIHSFFFRYLLHGIQVFTGTH